jgi:hypothetical protein
MVGDVKKRRRRWEPRVAGRGRIGQRRRQRTDAETQGRASTVGSGGLG